MHLRDKVIVVTGGAAGIGAGLCRRFAEEQPRVVVVADLDDPSGVANEIGGLAVTLDVRSVDDTERMIREVQAEYGVIDLYCANAGVVAIGGVELSDDVWRNIFEVNVMASVFALRALLPAWIERRDGYFLQMGSASSLMPTPGAVPYGVTKHAVLALADSIAMEYADRGIRSSIVCPHVVVTPLQQKTPEHAERIFWHRLYASTPADPAGFSVPERVELTPYQMADKVVDALRDEIHMIYPHDEVGIFFKAKADDYERWIRRAAEFQADHNSKTVTEAVS